VPITLLMEHVFCFKYIHVFTSVLFYLHPVKFMLYLFTRSLAHGIPVYRVCGFGFCYSNGYSPALRLFHCILLTPYFLAGRPRAAALLLTEQICAGNHPISCGTLLRFDTEHEDEYVIMNFSSVE